MDLMKLLKQDEKLGRFTRLQLKSSHFRKRCEECFICYRLRQSCTTVE